MVRPTTPIAAAARIPSDRRPGYGFSTAVRVQSAHPCYRDQKTSGNVDKLGYIGVVERCDSQEFGQLQPCSTPERESGHRKKAPNAKAFEMPNEVPRTPSWKAIQHRSPYAQRQRPSSAHVDNRHSRQNHHHHQHQHHRQALQTSRVSVELNGGVQRQGGFSPAHRQNPGNLDPRGHSAHQQYSPYRATKPQDQQAAPHAVRREPPSASKPGGQGGTGARSYTRPGTAQRIEENAELVVDTVPDEALEQQVKAQTAQIHALNTMLRQQQVEKLEMAQQNIQLQKQVEQLSTSPSRGYSANSRQRPWSASSAVSNASSRNGSGHQPVAHGFKIPMQGEVQQRLMSAYGRSDNPYAAGANRKVSGRPSSSNEPRQSPQGRLIQTGYNMRGKPMFGFASLEHREVYSPFPDCDPPPPEDMAVPTGPTDRERQHPPSQMGKDEVFDRPNAHRQLSMKGRPKSASAAARAPSYRPSSGAQRPGSARPSSSYAEKLLNQDADEFVGFHRADQHAGDDGRWVMDVLAAMRRRAANKYIRVIDFFTGFDRMRRGSVTCSEFRRALEACACFGDMPESDYDIVMEPFLEAVGQKGPSHRISYSAFCEVLQPVGDRRVKLNEHQRHLMSLGRVQPESVHSPFQANNLSRDGEVKLQSIITRITEQIKSARVSVRDLMESFDPRSLNGIRGFGPGFMFSDEELALLFCKYEKSGEFNYYLFCRDLEVTEGRQRI